MTDGQNNAGPRDFDGGDEQNRDLAPELDNAEQDDADAQANTVAAEALGRSSDDLGLGDTEKVATGDDSDDAQDLVDHMNQMVTSGRIDMDAFRGEPNMDEEDGRYGAGADETDPVTGEDQAYDPEDAEGITDSDMLSLVPDEEDGDMEDADADALADDPLDGEDR